MKTATSVADIGSTCGVCGLPLRARTFVCPGCGAVAPIERIGARLTRLWCRLSADPLRLGLWALSLAPFLIVPPLLAIVVAWLGNRRQPDRFDTTWLTMIALLNIAVSAVLIVRLHSQIDLLSNWLPDVWWRPVHAPKPAGLQSI